MYQHFDKLVLVCLLLAVMVAFEPIRSADFVDFDDYQYVADNEHV